MITKSVCTRCKESKCKEDRSATLHLRISGDLLKKKVDIVDKTGLRIIKILIFFSREKRSSFLQDIVHLTLFFLVKVEFVAIKNVTVNFKVKIVIHELFLQIFTNAKVQNRATILPTPTSFTPCTNLHFPMTHLFYYGLYFIVMVLDFCHIKGLSNDIKHNTFWFN